MTHPDPIQTPDPMQARGDLARSIRGKGRVPLDLALDDRDSRITARPTPLDWPAYERAYVDGTFAGVGTIHAGEVHRFEAEDLDPDLDRAALVTALVAANEATPRTPWPLVAVAAVSLAVAALVNRLTRAGEVHP